MRSPAGKRSSAHGFDRCSKQWLADLLGQGAQVLVPEITDYEVRRELIRARRTRGITHLDQLKATAGYIPITTDTMLLAAELWAQVRRQGQPTAPNLALDGDVIFAAPAQPLAQRESEPVMVATTNVGHLSRFVPARLWYEITAANP